MYRGLRVCMYLLTHMCKHKTYYHLYVCIVSLLQKVHDLLLGLGLKNVRKTCRQQV